MSTIENDTSERLTRSLRRNLIAGAAVILVLFGGVGGWAATTELSGAVIATGIVVVDGNAKKVQHPEGGIVAELRVKEGQLVRAGETVVRMDSTVAAANFASIEKNIAQLRARQARLVAERDGLAAVEAPPDFQNLLDRSEIGAAMQGERRLFEDRKVARAGQKARLNEQVQQLHEQMKGLDVQQQSKAEEAELIEKELVGIRRLYEIGAIPMSRVNNLDRSATRLKGDRGQLLASMASARGRVAEIEVQLLQIDQAMREEVAAELRDVQNKLAALAEDEVTARDRLKHAELKAPISGVIHLLAIHTIGGVISPAETLMEIVPQSSRLTVEARVAPQDIDQIAIGQSTTLRLTAFNRNTTPELKGSVVRISADLETDQTAGVSFYRAAIAIPDDEIARLSDMGLVPGMPVETFIRTADRSVASYFAKPIGDHMQRVFRQD